MNNTYRLPAEWETHQATWITWPCRLSVWPDYTSTCQAYAEVINAIAQFEPVYLVVNPEFLSMARTLCTAENVTYIDTITADDSWSRDTAPIFLKNSQELLATCWQFNAWGKKFSPYNHDAELSKKIAQYLDIHMTEIPMVLEGGSIHSNGQGTLMTTKECLLHTNRNPRLSQTDIEEKLKKVLHVDNIIWLNHGLDGDVDTDGHIDNVACFADTNCILIQSCDDSDDANYATYLENKAILEESVNAQGQSFTVHDVPQPPRSYLHGDRVPLSYINFYFANEAIILPSFDAKKTDDTAQQIFRDIFPKRAIISVPAWPILQGGGGIHCITMQQPKVDL